MSVLQLASQSLNLESRLAVLARLARVVSFEDLALRLERLTQGASFWPSEANGSASWPGILEQLQGIMGDLQNDQLRDSLQGLAQRLGSCNRQLQENLGLVVQAAGTPLRDQAQRVRSCDNLGPSLGCRTRDGRPQGSLERHGREILKDGGCIAAKPNGTAAVFIQRNRSRARARPHGKCQAAQQ